MAEMLTLEDNNIDQEIKNSELPLFVDLWAEWCRPCLKVAPIIGELAGQYEGKMRFGKLNVDFNPETARKYKVMSIPMFLVLHKGEILESFVGALPKKKFVEKIESALTKIQ